MSSEHSLITMLTRSTSLPSIVVWDVRHGGDCIQHEAEDGKRASGDWMTVDEDVAVVVGREMS